MYKRTERSLIFEDSERSFYSCCRWIHLRRKQEGKEKNFDIIKFIHESLIFIGGSESFRCNILSCAKTIFKGSNPL